MQTLRPFALGFVLALVALVPSRARAEGPLVMEEPRSGLHLEVPGGCAVKPAGDAACASFAASAHQAERFAVVVHDGALLSYSVAMFADPEPGTGEERAQKVVKSLGDAETSIVTYGGQPFLRAELHPSNGAAVCFVTIDDRPEVGIVMFASEPALADAMRLHADEVMRSSHRPGPPVRPRRVKTLLWGLAIPLLLLARLARRHLLRPRSR